VARVSRRTACLSASAILLACSACLSAGIWIGQRRLDERAFAEGQRRLLEFVANADALGIIDRERLDRLTDDQAAAAVAP